MAEEISFRDMTPEQRKAITLEVSNLTSEEYDRLVHERRNRTVQPPPVGADAPDFTVEKLNADGSRSGDGVRLSDFKGQPVALAFGSYT
jgi:hypothetical protein